LRQDLKVTNVFASLMTVGREFKSFGATEENAQSPLEQSRVLGTTKRPLWAERTLQRSV